MELTFNSLWEWTKLTVRAPATAFALVKAAKLPVEVSILMIVLAGIVSAAASGAHYMLIGAPDIILPLSETQGLQIERAGPIAQGVIAVITGVGLSYAIFWVGRRMGGQGSLGDILSVTAVLQMVVTFMFVGVYVMDLIFPIAALGLMLLSIYVAIRGLGHAVNVGHDYDSLGRSFWVSILSIIGLFVALVIVASFLGLAPDGVVVELLEGTPT